MIFGFLTSHATRQSSDMNVDTNELITDDNGTTFFRCHSIGYRKKLIDYTTADEI